MIRRAPVAKLVRPLIRVWQVGLVARLLLVCRQGLGDVFAGARMR